jgi:hypothetical protein
MQAGSVNRAKRLRASAEDGRWPLVAGHPLAATCASSANRLGFSLSHAVVSSTVKNYDAATNSYLGWCDDVCTTPWPIDQVRLASYIVDTASKNSVDTIAGYCSGLKFVQPMYTGCPWSLDGCVMVQQAMRFIKRKYGCSSPRVKFPVCLKAIRSMLPLLPGWPIAQAMSHDDNLFACASIIATMAFLRGGEFLINPQSSSPRPVLLGRAVYSQAISGVPTVVVLIPRPKNLWWEPHVEARCFSLPAQGEFDPLHRLRQYRRYSAVRLDPDDPAFRMADGSPLSRNWMVERTSSLLAQAKVSAVDDMGRRLPIYVSSWRTGGVKSATDVGLSGPMIMTLGRWKSLAWSAYAAHDFKDLRRAAESMWSGSDAHSAESLQRRVENTATFTAPVLDVAALRTAFNAL